MAQLGDSDKAQVGDWVIAIGAPFGLEETVTAGIISATGRHNVGISDYESFLQTDAAINPGNSGGPLVNMRGQVLGLNAAIASRSGGYMGVGFAVPINMAREVMKQIIETGKVTRGWLGIGIQTLTPAMAETKGLKSASGRTGQRGLCGRPRRQGRPEDRRRHHRVRRQARQGAQRTPELRRLDRPRHQGRDRRHRATARRRPSR